MKTRIKSLVTLAMVLTLGTAALSAQSCAAVPHVSQAVRHSGAASVEIVSAGVQSGAASVKVGAAIVAVPVFVSGAAVAGTGSMLAALGESGVAAGDATLEGAAKIWDFSNGAPAERPPLNRERAVPAAKQTTTVKPVDPSPAEALKAKR